MQRSDPASPHAGFVLLEVACIFAILGLLAMIVLPALPVSTTRARLQAFAIDIANLLRADQMAAIKGHRPVSTAVNAAARTVRSGSTRRELRLPTDVTMQAVLASRCNGRMASLTIDFLATGMSCGGTVTLSRPGSSYEIRVNWLTGNIDVGPNPVR
jgi:general secretion pathway protein H